MTLASWVRSLLNSRYRSERALPQGIDPAVTGMQLASEVLFRTQRRARAAVLLRRADISIGRGVRLRHRSLIALGAHVVLGDLVEVNGLARNGVTLASRVSVDRGAILRGSGVIRNLGEGIRIGERTSIGAWNVILGAGGVTIGDDCLLGPHVTVLSENHIAESLERPVREQGETRRSTTIGNDVWIGAGAVVLGGVRVGNHAVIGAGAVVSRDVPEAGVVGGVPARILRSRGVV